MSFQARIHDLNTGEFLLACRVEATNLHEAETNALFHAAQTLTCNPHNMDVRHLHQCTQRQDVQNPGQLR